MSAARIAVSAVAFSALTMAVVVVLRPDTVANSIIHGTSTSVASLEKGKNTAASANAKYMLGMCANCYKSNL